MSRRKPKVFISYGSQDQELAASLAAVLTRRGFDVWVDLDRLSAGTSIIGAISTKIAEADLVLVLLSHDSVASPWCRMEYETALTQEIETGAKRVIPVILDDVDIPAALVSKKRIDLRRTDTWRLDWVDRGLWDALNDLPIAPIVSERPRYSYSKLALIISGVLDELPIPSLNDQPLLAGRTLVDLYRTVERLIERFEEICSTLASVLTEAMADQAPYPSTMNLRSVGLIEANMKLTRIANDMREIARELNHIVARDGTVAQKLAPVANLCAVFSKTEDVLAVILSTKPTQLVEARDATTSPLAKLLRHPTDTYDFVGSTGAARDGVGLAELTAAEISDLERIVADMERYRIELRNAVANLTAP